MSWILQIALPPASSTAVWCLAATVVHWIHNLIGHLRDACGRTKRSFSTLPTHPSSTTSSRRKDSPSVRLTRKTVGENAHRSTRWVRRNWKRWWPQRRQFSSSSRQRRERLYKTAPSKIGCFQGLWHWDKFPGKLAVTLTPTSKEMKTEIVRVCWYQKVD